MKNLLLLIFLFSNTSYAFKAKGHGALIELYTSEGCSSCPPVERWLNEFKHKEGLWDKFVPLSFHVNYWDRLGWPDRFASEENTKRQRFYSALWRSSTVYTPGIVIQGNESRLNSSWEPSTYEIEVEWLNDQLKVKTSAHLKGEVHVAWLGMNENSQVKRGENSGKVLSHDFVVLKAINLGRFDEQKKYSLVKPNSTISTIKAIAVWIEKDHRPVVATGGLINP